MKEIYNPWPNGKVPIHLQRPELNRIKELGYEFDDARKVISIFENKVAKFAGSKYAISVDCCTHAIELSFRYLISIGMIPEYVGVPKHTYISSALVPINLGIDIIFEDNKWIESYTYTGTNIVDAAVLWKKGMYKTGTFHCISFQIKKIIPIGRGGMILTDDKVAYDWFKLARYDGRDLSLPYDHEDHLKMNGWHYYMTPEDAARGIILMDSINQEGSVGSWNNYPNVTKMMKL